MRLRADIEPLVPGSPASKCLGGGERARAPVRVAAIALVFLVALGARLLYYTESAGELYGVDQERYRIAQFYHQAAASLAEGNDRVLFPSGLPPDITLPAGYPPGYFAFMAGIYTIFGADMDVVLLAQCVVDAVAAVALLLLGESLFSTGVGTVAALLMALSPQFAYLSLVIKPDTLVVVPILLALVFVVRGAETGRLRHFVLAGACLGVGCWLRQNALLLAPALAIAVVALCGWREHWRAATMMVLACAALVAPVTLRNMALYGGFIPVTFGSGFALLSGLARDDYAGVYGLPRFAYNVSVEEAAARDLSPDYYFSEYDRFQAGEPRKFEVKHTVLSVFAVDGIARDRERARRARALILRDPSYFLSIYALRIWRLMDYSRQLRPVPLSAGPRDHAYETLEFYDPLGDLGSYYASEGRWYDRLRPPLARLQRAFSTWLLLVPAAVGLLITAVAAWRRALFLLLPPLYYLGLQSLMWAEFRHTLPVHLSLFLFIGVAACAASRVAGQALRVRPWRSSVMTRSTILSGVLAAAVCGGLALPAAGGQATATNTPAPAANPADVASMEAITAALYDVISGPAGKKRDWDRMRSLFAPGARLIPIGPRQNGEIAPRVLDVEGYIATSGPYLESNGFFEREAGRRVDTSGHIVHVFSAYEARHKADDAEPFMRGTNSIQLVNDGKRWWVVTVLWEAEPPAAKSK